MDSFPNVSQMKSRRIYLLSKSYEKAALSNEKTAFIGAGNVTRTHDLLITNQLLYRLSYTSIKFSIS